MWLRSPDAGDDLGARRINQAGVPEAPLYLHPPSCRRLDRRLKTSPPHAIHSESIAAGRQSMARSVRMLPSSRAMGRTAEVSITDKDWEHVEAAYGYPLSLEVRQSIVEATNELLYWEIFERNASPERDAANLISSIRDASNNLRGALSACGGNAGFVAQLLVKEHLVTPRLSLDPHEQLFHVLGELLFSLSSACSRALASPAVPDQTELTTASDEPTGLFCGYPERGLAPPFREGESWNAWVRRLNEIASSNRLPFKVSKGSDKSLKTSPFVLFVDALQKLLPSGSRHNHSLGGLAKAITAARRKHPGVEKRDA